jgi:hypothetical protein
MSAVVKLSDKLVAQAKRYASIDNRSIPKQIEHWSQIGRIAEDNPNLPYSFIKDILFALDESYHGEISEYSFDSK